MVCIKIGQGSGRSGPPSLDARLYHQIIFSEFNLKVYYPPPCERVVWQYQKDNKDLNSKSYRRFGLEQKFFIKFDT